MEIQRRADDRIPAFLKLPVRHKGILCEPLLEKLVLDAYLKTGEIAQVLCGGEQGADARVCDFAWVLELMNQCVNCGVAFRFCGPALFSGKGTGYTGSRRRNRKSRRGGQAWTTRHNAGRNDRMNVQYAKEVIELPAGSGGKAETLLMRLIRAGHYVDAPCGGKGTCGRCRVRFVSEAPQPTANERRLLTEEERSSGVRLACEVRVAEACSLQLPVSREQEIDVLVTADAADGAIPSRTVDEGIPGQTAGDHPRSERLRGDAQQRGRSQDMGAFRETALRRSRGYRYHHARRNAL